MQRHTGRLLMTFYSGPQSESEIEVNEIKPSLTCHSCACQAEPGQHHGEGGG